MDLCDGLGEFFGVGGGPEEREREESRNDEGFHG
jgi:hypothetical protein